MTIRVYKALNPGAVNKQDRYLIIDQHTNRVIESHSLLDRAIHFKHVLEDHARKHNHPHTYYVRKTEDVEYID